MTFCCCCCCCSVFQCIPWITCFSLPSLREFLDVYIASVVLSQIGSSNLGQMKVLKTEIQWSLIKCTGWCWMRDSLWTSISSLVKWGQWMSPKDCSAEMDSVAQGHSAAAWHMGDAHSVPNPLYTLPRTHCICWEITGLREITDTSTFYSADSMLGKFSHSLEQQGKGPIWIILKAIDCKLRCLARQR